jgi:hypothetical protein
MTTALDLIYEALKDKWFASRAVDFYYDIYHDPKKTKIYQRVEMDSDKSLRWVFIVVNKTGLNSEVSSSYEDFTSDETADKLREVKDDRMIRKLTAIEALYALSEEDEDDDDCV